MAVVALYIIDEHRRSARAHDGRLDPADAAFVDDVRGVPPEVIVTETHGDDALAAALAYDRLRALDAQGDSAFRTKLLLTMSASLAALNVLRATQEQLGRTFSSDEQAALPLVLTGFQLRGALEGVAVARRRQRIAA